jgi:hypothetical protein
MPAPGIADRTPDKGALDHVFLAFGVGLVLRPLEIVHVLPARLRAAKRLPVELDVEPFSGKVALLLGDEIVETHALRRDFHMLESRGHGVAPGCSAPRSVRDRAG